LHISDLRSALGCLSEFKKLSSSFTLKLISAFNAFKIESIVALLAMPLSLEIWAF